MLEDGLGRKRAGSCKTLYLVDLEEQPSLPQGQGQAMLGDGKVDGLSPSFGNPVAGKIPRIVTSLHSHDYLHQVPTTCQPIPPPPGLALAKAGAGPYAENHSTLCPPSLTLLGSAHAIWWGCSLGNQGCGIGLAEKSQEGRGGVVVRHVSLYATLPEPRHHRLRRQRCSSEILKSRQWEPQPLPHGAG